MKKKLSICLLSVILTLLLPMGAMAAETEGNSTKVQGLINQMKEQLSDAFEDMDEETGREIFSFVKEKVTDGSLDTEQGLQEVLRQGEEKFGVKLDEAEARKLVDLMEQLESMGFSAEYVVGKAEGLYQEYGADFVDHVDEVVTGAVKNAAANVVSNLWTGLKGAVKDFFYNIFG